MSSLIENSNIVNETLPSEGSFPSLDDSGTLLPDSATAITSNEIVSELNSLSFDSNTNTEPISTRTKTPNEATVAQNSTGNVPTDVKRNTKKRSSSGEDTIEILDVKLVVKSSGPSSTCIDLTEDAANDIIIEKSVGIKQKKRSLPYKNKIRAPTNNLNATIVIDDDSPNPPTITASRPSFRPVASHMAPMFFSFPNASCRIATGPSPPKRPKSGPTESEKRKEFLQQQQAAAATTASAAEQAESSNSAGVQCPICLENLAELKKNNKRLKSTTCGHILCNECMDATFKSVGALKTIVCPTCRAKLTKSKVHDLFL